MKRHSLRVLVVGRWIRKCAALLYAVRTPSLRNLGATAPYMHNGVFARLDDVVGFYRRITAGGGGWSRSPRLGRVVVTVSAVRAPRRATAAARSPQKFTKITKKTFCDLRDLGGRCRRLVSAIVP